MSSLARGICGRSSGNSANSKCSNFLHEDKISRRSEISAKVESLLEMRESARASKNWSESDRIRWGMSLLKSE